MGDEVGVEVGSAVGKCVGSSVGAGVGTIVGIAVGGAVGALVGATVAKQLDMSSGSLTKPSKHTHIKVLNSGSMTHSVEWLSHWCDPSVHAI